MNPTSPPPPPPPGATPNPSQPPCLPPATNLKQRLDNLRAVIDYATTTLNSLPPAIKAIINSNFLPCPFDPNHRMPPSALFSHYLRCPSPVSLPHTFHYPHTLRSATTPTPPPTLPPDSSDLTVSLDNYIGYHRDATFFYQNCPGAVTISTVRPPSSVNLPRFLFIECADFNDDDSLKGLMDFSVDCMKLLPSQIWVLNTEIEEWVGGIPAAYSLRVLRAILRLRDSTLSSLRDWIIENSPRYGVIVDWAMTDHMVVLVKLCLKAIVKEAFVSTGFTRSDEEVKREEGVFGGCRSRSFKCPLLAKVTMWLSMLFSILYGVSYGQYFTYEVLKKCISDSAMRASLFPIEGFDDELSDGGKVNQDVEEQVQSSVSTDGTKKDEKENIRIDGDKVNQDVEEPVQSSVSIDGTKKDEQKNIRSETVGNSMVFISDVAAAVAALHERLLIEEKIKALRSSPPPAYQRNMEHEHVSKLGDEERQKRPDYRPIIEHDGSLRQRSTNQEVNKVKTREELLAEERDYKRRRMSYRGKKVKRNTLEVMRDIIDEYMEEIRQAEGIGSTSKAVEEREALDSKKLDKHASATDVSGSRRNSETLERSRGRSVDYGKDSHSRHYSGDLKDNNQQPRQGSTWDHGCQYANRNVESVRYERDDHSGSRDGKQISNHSREQMHAREKLDFVDAFAEDRSRRSHQRQNESHDRKYYKRSGDEHERRTHKRGRDGHERTSHKKERDDDDWEHGDRGRRETDSPSRDRDEEKGRHADRRKSKTNRNSSFRHELHEFGDRYNPAETHDSYDDDF